MSKIKQIDLLVVNELFERKGEPGYILNFSDKSFAQFFARELGVDIDDQKYHQNGKSKGKRLRYFLEVSDDDLAARTLEALWEYRSALITHSGKTDEVPNAHKKLLDLVHKLRGGAPAAAAPKPTKLPVLADAVVAILRQELLDLSCLDPHPRGYAFEIFLRKLFDAYGMEARQAFRNRGEQIDGSFQLQGETYLLEAKWQNARTDAAELRAFNAKVEEKAAWSRGLFISNSGFTPEGVHAFGRGKRVVCMDGRDLYETLTQGRSLVEVLLLKVRRAAETGEPFIGLTDLY